MALSQIPRIPLAHLPTPLEYLPRLSEELGGPRILVKRDDCTGLALGGNKTRKLEFLIAEAQAQGADTIVTIGGVQSNHVRQTAAAAARVGLSCHLVLARAVPWDDPAYEVSGNVQLDHLLGAQVHLLPEGTDRDGALRRIARALRTNGRSPYVIPSGGSNAIGAMGYAACAVELEEQARAAGETIDYLIHATGSGGTQAGLIAGLHGADSQIQVLGIDITAAADEIAGKVRTIARDTSQALAQAKRPPRDALQVISGYAGSAYGMPTEQMRSAVRMAARLEGLILDPVYTGKAMAGLIDLVRQGRFSETETIVFLHTGGMPGLFAYNEYFRDETGA
ncbi:MAG: D-cysteine desulfhydrase [Alphaproteobacteria bacterium]|jgi:L-cysteate sulfo-lyase|nr:D-cysteine desulfhydrase [Alphaproteobacteria bacterium]